MSAIDKEIEWLRSEVLPKILKNGKLIENYNEDKADTFHIKNIDIKFIGAEEAFMLTNCYRATINFEYNKVAEVRKLVVKKTPNIPDEVYDNINFDALFKNEINFYLNILPQLQKYANGEFNAPKYYYSESQRSFATIILGDFGSDGWCVTNNRYGLSLEHALLAANNIGKFHGLGYALKHTNNELFKQLTNEIKEGRWANDNVHPEWELSIKTSMERVVKVTQEYAPEVDKDFVLKLQRMTNNFVRFGRHFAKPVEPLATICHGDYLRNNVAYKYDNDNENKDVPNDIMMFDYQTIRVASPMIDLSVFMTISILSEVRDKNFDQIFDAYINALTESYVQLTKKPVPSYLSRESMLKEYIRFLPYSLHVVASFLMALVDPKNVSNDELFNEQRTTEEIIQDSLTRGGKLVDRELAQQARVLYALSRQHGVDIAEGYNLD